MDFLAQQEAARRKSGWLMLVSLLSVIPVIAMTALVLDFVVWLFAVGLLYKRGAVLGFAAFVCENAGWTNLWVPCAAAAIVLWSGYCAYRRIADGAAVMERLGAEKVRGEEAVALMNVVEEMALASGCGVPSVWRLNEVDNVNALVAGFGDGDAALCVTEGALKYLSRDELQGVVAHEFGHILNGDMGLNTRLAAIVEGMNGIADLGGAFRRWTGERLRLLADAGEMFSITRRNRVSVLDLIMYLVGVSLQVIGGAGRMCGRALQGAVSREREYLADAAAVQFTRNPEGLADALRFAHHAETRGWRTRAASAANVAHMFFVEESWSAARTHPSLESRVRRLSRSGLGDVSESLRRRIRSFRQVRAEKIAENLARYESYSRVKATKPHEADLPPALVARLRNPGEAGSLLCALLRTGAIPDVPLRTASEKRRLVAKAVSSIRQFASPAAVAAWAERIDALAKNGETHGSFEFMVSCAVNRQLRAQAPESACAPRDVAAQVARVVSTVAALGRNPAHACALAGSRLSPVFRPWPAHPAAYDDLIAFRDALRDLQRLTPLLKREVLTALRVVIEEDGEISDDEGNYLAAVADAIGAFGWQGC